MKNRDSNASTRDTQRQTTLSVLSGAWGPLEVILQHPHMGQSQPQFDSPALGNGELLRRTVIYKVVDR